jgi:hypothetical protein
MRHALLLLAICALTSATFGQAAPAPISETAVWQSGGDFLSQAHAACDKVTPSSKFADCVISQMSKAGAPADAVSFTRVLYKQSGGEVGILSGFHKVGPVDVAWVQYPLRNGSGLLLVNGKPQIVNAEDLKLLDEKDLQQSFQFQNLQSQFPKVAVFPGDRDGKTWPNNQTGNKGGLQFIIGYPLRDGCATCAHAGFALFTWHFDPGGKFKGTSFMGMTPAPLGQSGQSAPQQ